LILTCDFDTRTRPKFFSIYVTTKQKEDICNSFQTTVRTHTQAVYTSIKSIIAMHVFIIL